MKIRVLFLAAMLCALCVGQASALEYTMEAPDDYLFARPTSDETIYEWENPNVDRSKNTALIPPAFGSAASYLPGSGTALTPNLTPGGSGIVSGGGTSNVVTPPTISGNTSSGGAGVTGNFTLVTPDLYYAGGYIGSLKIPSIGVDVKIYQGTGSGTLAKGAGHFTDTSIWDGTVALAGHNRGVNNHFGKIHTLEIGDKITLTTKLGTRTYKVTSVSKVSETDRSAMTPTGEDRIVLYTCVMNQSAYRWCVQATAV